MPQRVQLSRRKGWRRPENCVVVARPSQWGNPFRVTATCDAATAVAKYRYEIVQMNGGVVGFNLFWVRQHLAGKDLGCWCRLDQPCHADVLLELANDLASRGQAAPATTGELW